MRSNDVTRNIRKLKHSTTSKTFVPWGVGKKANRGPSLCTCGNAHIYVLCHFFPSHLCKLRWRPETAADSLILNSTSCHPNVIIWLGEAIISEEGSLFHKVEHDFALLVDPFLNGGRRLAEREVLRK